MSKPLNPPLAFRAPAVIYTRLRAMPELLARETFAAPGDAVIDERAARVELRRQVGRLERELAGLLGEAFGRVEIEHRLPGPGASAPRVLDLGGLERIRDALAERVAYARIGLKRRAREETSKRQLLAAMLESPADFKWVQVTRGELGEPGCGAWHSRPRLGPIGMLMGWWRVKVSSGCPLPGRLAAVEQEAAQAQAAPAHPPG